MKKAIYLLVVLTAVCFSCSKEKGTVTGADEREVEMTFLLPGAAITRAGIATAEENDIKNLTLLVFDSGGTYQYSRYAWEKSTSDNTGIYTTTLKIDQGITIYFAANWATVLEDLDKAGIKEGASSYNDVVDALIMDAAETMDLATDGLPMWGHKTGVDIEDKALNVVKDVQLIRSVASIDITMSAPNFILQEGHVVYAADKGYLPYNTDAAYMQTQSGVLRAVAPFTPAGFTTSVDLEYKLTTPGNEIKNKFYVYENSTDDNPGLTGNRTTKVVLAGIWDDPQGSGKTTYYPISLRCKNSLGEYEKKKVMRNNKFSIVIVNVHGDGYDSLDDARNADDLNTEYEVIDWDDNQDGDLIIDGTKYFYRNKTLVTLYRPAGSTDDVTFRTNYELSDIEMKFDGEPDSAYTDAGTIENSRFHIEIVDDGSVGFNSGVFRVTAKEQYGASGNTAVVNVRVKRIAFNINIEQIGSHPDDWNYGGNSNHEVE